MLSRRHFIVSTAALGAVHALPAGAEQVFDSTVKEPSGKKGFSLNKTRAFIDQGTDCLEIITNFSRGIPRVGKVCWTAFRMA